MKNTHRASVSISEAIRQLRTLEENNENFDDTIKEQITKAIASLISADESVTNVEYKIRRKIKGE